MLRLSKTNQDYAKTDEIIKILWCIYEAHSVSAETPSFLHF